jgi:hypothetical protein
MKLTIDGKDYELPEFSAADFDDWPEQVEILQTGKDRKYTEVHAAAIKILTGFVKVHFPDLEDRSIKRAIPNKDVMKLVGELLYGKKDDAPTTLSSV